MLDITFFKNEQIPFIHYRLKDEQYQKPIMILLYHGWGSSTVNMRFLASTLALWGNHVITPEIRFHDSRNNLENHFQKEIQEHYFWRTIIESVPDVTQLSSRLNDIFDTENYQHVLFGSSMGGLIVSSAFMNNPNINGLITLNGSGNWTECETHFQKIGFQKSKFIDQLTILDPISNLHAINERPVLLMHGADDQVIPPYTQEMFFEKAQQRYVNPTKIRFMTYPNVNHTTTLGMIEQAVSWLNSAFPLVHQKV